jgi:mRNA-degrading endonuclease RelE of RelBE toxin-antitoxin system
MAHEIILAPEAVADLRGLSARDRAIVVDAMERHLRHEPGKVSRSRIKRLRGVRKPQYRLRVDDLRVFYDVSRNTVEVLAVVSKASAEQWLRKHSEGL